MHASETRQAGGQPHPSELPATENQPEAAALIPASPKRPFLFHCMQRQEHSSPSAFTSPEVPLDPELALHGHLGGSAERHGEFPCRWEQPQACQNYTQRAV